MIGKHWKGKDNPNYGGKLWKGKRCLEETKRKIGLGNKGKIRSEATRKKVSEGLKKAYKEGRKAPTRLVGEKNPMFGKENKWGKHTQETKDKISKFHIGKPKSKESINKRTKTIIDNKLLAGKNNPMYGKHHSEETKRKISKFYIGKPKSKESINKRTKTVIENKLRAGKNNPMYGKENKWGNHSEETIDKIKKTWNDPEHIKIARENRAKQIFPKIDTKIEQKIQNFLSLLHIEFFTHKYIKINHGYQCDIFIPKQETEGVIIPQKTIIECDGDYFHMNPNKFKSNDKCFKNGMTAKERWKLDNNRTKELQEKGFRVIRLWGSEIKVMEVNDLRNKII